MWKETFMPRYSTEICAAYFEMVKKRSVSFCKLTIKAIFAMNMQKKADFIYDSRDMCIPGIGVDLDSTRLEVVFVSSIL